MKLIILIFVFFGFFYYVFESIYNRISIGPIIERILKKHKCSFFGFSSIISFFMGGLCSTIIYFFYLIPGIEKLPIIVMMIIGGVIITIIELGFGILFNIKLKFNLWDYSNSTIGKFPVHFLGQIDLFHSIGWVGMSYLIVKIFDFLRWIIL